MSKAHWATTTLEDICQPGDGLQTGPFGSQLHASEYTTDGVPVIMPKDMLNQRVSTATIARIPEGRAEDLKRHRLKIGDIVFGRRGDIGRCALITNKEEGWICGSGSLRVRVTESISPQYLIYYLSQPEVVYWLQANAVGQTMLNLSAGILASLPVEFPPLAEQRKIADILSTWDEAIELTERLLTAKQKRKQALMQQLLTGKVRFPESAQQEWSKDYLINITTIDYGKSPSEIRDDNGKFYIYGTGGIVGKTNLALCECPAVIIGRKGTIDKPILVEQPFWTIDTTFYCLPKPNISVQWLYYALSQIDLKKYNEASGVPSLSRNTLYSIDLDIPSMEEQCKIAKILRICDQEIDLLRQKLAALRQQKKGLMQQLLTGKIRVKV